MLWHVIITYVRKNPYYMCCKTLLLLLCCNTFSSQMCCKILFIYMLFYHMHCEISCCVLMWSIIITCVVKYHYYICCDMYHNTCWYHMYCDTCVSTWGLTSLFVSNLQSQQSRFTQYQTLTQLVNKTVNECVYYVCMYWLG